MSYDTVFHDVSGILYAFITIAPRRRSAAMKTVSGNKGVLGTKSQDKGGKNLSRHFLIQIRSVHAIQDLKNMPKSSWRGHIAERIGHLILIALIWSMPVQSKAEMIAKTSVDAVSSRILHMEFLNTEAGFREEFHMASLSVENKEIARELGQFEIKDQVLLSWKTFFRDQSMLRRRIDVYA
jgi:hypothetical protein